MPDDSDNVKFIRSSNELGRVVIRLIEDKPIVGRAPLPYLDDRELVTQIEEASSKR